MDDVSCDYMEDYNDRFEPEDVNIPGGEDSEDDENENEIQRNGGEVRQEMHFILCKWC